MARSRSKVRTTTLGIRLSPRRKFQIELATRITGMTLTSFIEWALDKALESLDMPDENQLWSDVDADRIFKMAKHVPELLTAEERMAVDYVKSNRVFYVQAFNSPKIPKRIPHNEPNMAVVSASWPLVMEHVHTGRKLDDKEIIDAVMNYAGE